MLHTFTSATNMLEKFYISDENLLTTFHLIVFSSYGIFDHLIFWNVSICHCFLLLFLIT